jgi:myo-inositol-1(or 4)-monophosphatase
MEITMTENLKQFLEDIARGAGAIIKDSFGKIKTWQTKTGPGDIVTEIDYVSERYIISHIQERFPHDSIVSEEAGIITAPSLEDAVHKGRTWFVDPIDGTRNFALGIPFFCVSIGVVEQGIVTHGVIYDPVHDDLYYAERGKGATLNGIPIKVSETKDFEDAVLSISWARQYADYREFLEYIAKVSPHSSYFRRLGSAALVLCYVASGRLDAYLQGGVNSWDVAAGMVIVEEAGGKVTDFCGNPLDLDQAKIEILAANPNIHELMKQNVCRT